MLRNVLVSLLIVAVLTVDSVQLPPTSQYENYLDNHHGRNGVNTSLRNHHDLNGQNNSFVKKVHLIFMNHLDVGYDGLYPVMGYVDNILNKYFNDYFPMAVKIPRLMRKHGYVERQVYTTHSWLVSLYLDCPPNLILGGVKLQCPNNTAREAFAEAIRSGDISWHAGPMNMQIETMFPWLFKFGLKLGEDLDAQFHIKRPIRVLSQRDVPGLTAASVPLMAEMGVGAITVGVNPMTPPPDVPAGVFRWGFDKAEVLATWNKGGYPVNPGPDPAHPQGMSASNCAIIPNFEEAMCFAFRTDNWGPPRSVQEVLNYFEIARAQFPNADVAGSTFDDFFSSVSAIRNKLPVFTKEIGDTWIQGIASDPRKTAEFRVAMRVLEGCFTKEKCNLKDPRVYNASRFLLKPAEHTWGLPGVRDKTHWSNDDLKTALTKLGLFKNASISWMEQRRFVLLSLDALLDHPIADVLRMELKKLRTYFPDVKLYKTVDNPVGKLLPCGLIDLGFASDGSITSFVINGANYASDANRLAQFVYSSYNEKDFEAFGRMYNYDNASAGYYKRGSDQYAGPISKDWMFIMSEVFLKPGDQCSIYVHLVTLDRTSHDYYGAPDELWIQYTSKGHQLQVELQIFSKTRTRLPEAMFMKYSPDVLQNCSWRISKFASWIDVMDIATNGSQYQHVADDHGVGCMDSSGHGIVIASPDTPLVCFPQSAMRTTVFPAPLSSPKANHKSVSFNLYNNIWDTNYILWYPFKQKDEHFKSVFTISVI